MWAWRDVTLLHNTHVLYSHTHTHSLFSTNTQTPLCIHNHARKACTHVHMPTHTTHKSKPSGADQLFSCGGRSQLRHLKRTERSAWRRLPLLWFFTLRRSISLMQSCRALASIKSNIYQEIKRGERAGGREGERGQRGVLWHIQEMVRWRDVEKIEKKKSLNRKHGCCYLEGGVGVTTGVSHLSNTHISVCKVCVRCVYVYTYSTRGAYLLSSQCV